MKYSVRFSGSGRVRQAKASEQDGKTESSTRNSPTASPVARRLALAHHIERLVDQGVLRDYAHGARVLGVTRARMTQLMDLLMLAPEVQERVLVGDFDGGERRLRSLVAEPWATQARRVRARTTRARD